MSSISHRYRDEARAIILNKPSEGPLTRSLVNGYDHYTLAVYDRRLAHAVKVIKRCLALPS
jgi:hypothetical protein